MSAIATAPHLLDPGETEVTSRKFHLKWSSDADQRTRIAEQKRTIEHEQAVLRGMEAAFQERVR